MNADPEQHLVQRFDEELQAIRSKVIEMGELVLNQLSQGNDALKNRDLSLARGVIDREREVNRLEIETDSDICAILARRCPVARDLRTVMAASKIVNNLERIGDEAAKLANFVVCMYSAGYHEAENFPLDDLHKLAGAAIDLLKSTLAGFERQDIEKAREITEFHRALDQQFQSGLHRLMSWLQMEDHDVGNAVSQVLMMKALERIGDHAQNIAEYVIYQAQGEDVRHLTSDFGSDFPL